MVESGMMHAADQATFIANTERDAILLNTSTSVSWEFLGTWNHALSEFYPQYSAENVVRGIFPVNVPYMVPVAAFGLKEEYKVLNRTVVFRPREWRGAGCSVPTNCQSVSDLAAKINTLDQGSIAPFYVTSDGGASLQDIYDVVALLDDHV